MHDQQRPDRRSRSGSRHRRHRGGRDSSRAGAPSQRHAPVKLSFWQKLASFFKSKPVKPNNPKAAGSPRAASAPASQADRAPAQNGHRRFEAVTPRRLERKPEQVEVSSPKIYVGNLSFDATEADLFDLFNGVGQVQNAEIVSNRYTQRSKGFGFVTMLTVEEARRAVAELHDKEFMGRKLVVSGARTGERDGAPRQPEPRPEGAPATL